MRIISITFLVFLSSFIHAQLATSAEDICPLLVGETIKETSLQNSKGKQVPVEDIFEDGPTVILAYRGGWCPYCNRHLAEVGGLFGEIKELGYQVIAVSPDAMEENQNTLDRNDLEYQLYSDSEGEFSKHIGIAFQAEERHTQRLSNYSGGKNKGYLPVPAAFVVDEKGTILFEHISPNYTERLRGNVLMAVLKSLKQ